MDQELQRISDCIEGEFDGNHILVVGDIMLDRNLSGTIDRISPESPVPLVNLKGESSTLGGAANVANNLAQLGIHTTLAGFIGSDASGDELLRLLHLNNINQDLIIKLDDRPTITKSRIMVAHQQIIRIDDENVSPVPMSQIQRMEKDINSKLRNDVKLLILSDYGKGTIPRITCQNLIKEATKLGIPVCVDPKGNDFSKYKGATVISPNREEMKNVSRTSSNNLDELLQSASELRKELDIKFMVVTLSEQGIALITEEEISHRPTIAKDVFDVTGAGDTVISVLAACMSVELPMPDSITAALSAASIVVGKSGTVPITKEELIKSILGFNDEPSKSKIHSKHSIKTTVKLWQSQGKKIIFTNGCFDLLHLGHVALIESAKKLGDRLIVAINSDKSVKNLKGDSRPIVKDDERSQILAALAAVDAVIIYDEGTPLELINLLRPDILVKGGDYKKMDIVGYEEMKSWGGTTVTVPLLEGYSTTSLIKKMGS